MVVIALSSQEIKRFLATCIESAESEKFRVDSFCENRVSRIELSIETRSSILARIENRVSTYIWAVLYLLILENMFKLQRNIRRGLFFQLDSLVVATILVSRNVKIWKFKMLYFLNERRHGTQNLPKNLFLGHLQPGVDKIQKTS